MDLKFLGRGSAFNPKEGNNSAYFIDRELFLIDCGESVFERLYDNSLLNYNINLLITHTHSDHIGSIGSLVMYCYYVLNKPLNIVVPRHDKYIDSIDKILSCFGCTNDMYNFVFDNSFDNLYNSFQSVRYVKTKHCDNLECFSILFNTRNGVIYYSGDTFDTSIIKNIVDNEKIDKLYIDTTSIDSPSNVHLYIGILKDIIQSKFKNKVYCMHINSDECIEMAKDIGFNVVEVESKKVLVKNK